MAENTRKWVSVMDTKAGFLSALNLAVIGWLWAPHNLGAACGVRFWFGCAATACCLGALAYALRVVLPRTDLRSAFGKPAQYSSKHKAISFFGYVAAQYPMEKHEEFMRDVDGMDEKTLAREALEQHYTICHVVQKKADAVARAGVVTILGVALGAATVMVR
jgi:hypothetical protein